MLYAPFVKRLIYFVISAFTTRIYVLTDCFLMGAIKVDFNLHTLFVFSVSGPSAVGIGCATSVALEEKKDLIFILCSNLKRSTSTLKLSWLTLGT
ncbi:hypothetical protein FKM82_007498 [Ascaphus truei]